MGDGGAMLTGSVLEAKVNDVFINARSFNVVYRKQWLTSTSVWENSGETLNFERTVEVGYGGRHNVITQVRLDGAGGESAGRNICVISRIGVDFFRTAISKWPK